MRELRSLRRALLLLPLFALLAVAPGCDDDDNPATPEEEHLEAFGVRLLVEEQVVVTAEGADVTGFLPLTVGEITQWIDIELLDGDGEWYDPDNDMHHPAAINPGEEHEHANELELEVDDASIATFTTGEDATDGDFIWTMFAEGLAEGSTNLRIVVLHEGHEDYVSPWLPVTVSPPAP